jgi:lipid II:glycine glycyltransferase (peptidoglycan interpeptide bridge formation enzyme)
VGDDPRLSPPAAGSTCAASPTDPEDHLFGLIQFKLGTGGYAQEYLGEWDLALRPALAKAFDVYLSRR